MSYNYVYYKDEEMACNAASDVLEHGLTCNKIKSSHGEINMVSHFLVVLFVLPIASSDGTVVERSVNYLAAL